MIFASVPKYFDLTPFDLEYAKGKHAYYIIVILLMIIMKKDKIKETKTNIDNLCTDK
jgi:hypothetical protein